MPAEVDDDRHRREEQERRAKRKASKISKSDAQLEKERKRKEHRQKILQKHGGVGESSSSSSKRAKKTEQQPAVTSSAFQDLFKQRAQGFEIDFRFRNAPPRPPVGPTFVGNSLDAVLLEQSKLYKPLNAVEVNYTWKLHSEPDLGVPLAPSAMDLKSYQATTTTTTTTNDDKSLSKQLHPDDQALLEWTGSMGDTAADNLKRRQERARVAARMAFSGRGAAAATATTTASVVNPQQQQQQQQQQQRSKKAFSRVLDEGMQTWMKKTTYLSNDYSRKVHDFKSLAQSKQELEQDLQAKQEEITKRRSARAILRSFVEVADYDNDRSSLQHPTRKQLKPQAILPVLPHVSEWGRDAYTHVVMDKPPALSSLPSSQKNVDNVSSMTMTMTSCLNQAIVGHVEKQQASARMSCQLLVPTAAAANVTEDDADDDEKEKEDGSSKEQQQDSDMDEKNKNKKKQYYQAAQTYDLDVVPLKEGDAPHVHFSIWVDKSKGIAQYLPISSRVQLSSGRPVRGGDSDSRALQLLQVIGRRPLSSTEREEMEERMAEVDQDLAEKHHISMAAAAAASRVGRGRDKETSTAPGAGSEEEEEKKAAAKKNDDGEDDFGDDDDDSDSSGDEALFGASKKTIVAEG